MNTTPPVLSVTELTAWYQPDQPILREVNLEVPARTNVGLLGVNGAGKTTLLNCLCGVHERLRVGQVQHQGRLVGLRDKSFLAARYAVFTEHAGFRYWTFTAYLAFLAKAYARQMEPRAVDELVEGFAFGRYRDQTIGSLSTGNKKKAFLIAGLALRLPLLLLDEPVDGLDFESTEFLYDSVAAYREWGSVLMSSHIAESFSRCSDRLYVLRGGRLGDPVDDAAVLRDVRSYLARD
jgi:ABC-2 type transport system ATP-binding protein